MQAGFHYAAKMPYKKIWTTLAVQNDRGLGFYKSFGFREIAQISFINCNFRAPPAPFRAARR